MDPTLKYAEFKELLDYKYQIMNSIAANTITWWVSAVVFCSTIVVGAWIQKDQLKRFPLFRYAGLIITVFLFTVVLFGCWVVYGLQRLHEEVDALQAAFGLDAALSTDFTFVTYQIAIVVGTTSFVMLLVMWVRLWLFIARESSSEEGEG